MHSTSTWLQAATRLQAIVSLRAVVFGLGLNSNNFTDTIDRILSRGFQVNLSLVFWHSKRISYSIYYPCVLTHSSSSSRFCLVGSCGRDSSRLCRAGSCLRGEVPFDHSNSSSTCFFFFTSCTIPTSSWLISIHLMKKFFFFYLFVCFVIHFVWFLREKFNPFIPFFFLAIDFLETNYEFGFSWAHPLFFSALILYLCMFNVISTSLLLLLSCHLNFAIVRLRLLELSLLALSRNSSEWLTVRIQVFLSHCVLWSASTSFLLGFSCLAAIPYQMMFLSIFLFFCRWEA